MIGTASALVRMASMPSFGFSTPCLVIASACPDVTMEKLSASAAKEQLGVRRKLDRRRRQPGTCGC